MTAPDDVVIPDWELLVRRAIVNKNSVQITTSGTLQFTTAGFKIDEDGVSLYRASLLHLLGCDLGEVVGGRENGVPVGLMVGHVRSAGCGVIPGPISIPQTEIDPAHALITFDQSSTRAAQKRNLHHALTRAFVLTRTITVRGEPAEVVVAKGRPDATTTRAGRFVRSVLRRRG
jgi:hypothetical protein